MTQRPARLQVEELDARILPSTAAFPLPVPPAAAALTAHPPRHHALAGHGQGRYTRELVPADFGGVFDLQGAADMAGLGRVTATGRVNSVGFVPSGRAGGTLTFANARGSVTVQLRGPEQRGFSPLPQQFHYQVVSGAGAFRHLADQGTLQLALQAGPTFLSGTFTLTL
jgi:hypothetical protein